MLSITKSGFSRNVSSVWQGCSTLLNPRNGLRRAEWAKTSNQSFLQRSFAKEVKPHSVVQELKRSTKFGLEELNVLYNKFLRKSGDPSMDRKEFSKAMEVVGITDAVTIERYFLAFDQDKNGVVDFREFACNLSILLRGTSDEKYKFIFQLWDEDKNGVLSKDEFVQFLGALSRASPQETTGSKELGEAIFSDIDVNGDGGISFEEFKRGVLRHQISLPSLYFDVLAHEGLTVDESLTVKEQEVISLLGEKVIFESGHFLPAASEQPNGKLGHGQFFILLNGELEICTTTNVGVHKINKRGSVFGENVLFNPSTNFSLIRATKPTAALAVNTEDFLPLVYHGHPGATLLMERLGRNMMHILKLFEHQILGNQIQVSPTLVHSFTESRNALLTEWALKYHALGAKGKLGIHSTKHVGSTHDLSIAYSPGVAQPCLAIQQDPATAYEYTAKSHLVGVVSNGTAVLGLGNIGALASKPVMEGKAVLFKKFGGLDSFDIEINESNPDKLIDIVVSLEPTFGGINLEDIKAPECFYIEKECQRRMNIPIMHDDQHGTAIVAGAGLLNALKLINKKIEDIRVVVSGCGAAGFTCSKYLLALGVRKENLVALDVLGVVHKGREDLVKNPASYLNEVAADTDKRTLGEVIVGADLFLGVSVGNLLKPDMLLRMNESPLIFALANPTPEINYHVAMATRKDIIMATGRSDFPNQINNVCAFPFIFRGALDVQATKINEEMKHAATRAIASLVHDTAFDQPKFARDYILPKPFDPRLRVAVSSAVAKAAMDSGVARKPVDLEDYRKDLEQMTLQ